MSKYSPKQYFFFLSEIKEACKRILFHYLIISIFMKIILCFFISILLFSVFSTSFAAKTPVSNPQESAKVSANRQYSGQLKQVEDSGYPYFTLTIELAKGGVEVFGINVEEVKNINSEMLSGWIGKEVSFDFNTEISNALLDLTRGGKSILNPDGFTPNEETKTVSGIFSGAETETAGDIPDFVYITTVAEISVPFEMFITRELVDANGSEVVGYYEERIQNIIKHINVVK